MKQDRHERAVADIDRARDIIAHILAASPTDEQFFSPLAAALGFLNGARTDIADAPDDPIAKLFKRPLIDPRGPIGVVGEDEFERSGDDEFDDDKLALIRAVARNHAEAAIADLLKWGGEAIDSRENPQSFVGEATDALAEALRDLLTA